MLIMFVTLYGNAAAASQSVEELIQDCSEYVAIYNARERKSFFAGISTSVSEALRAGICLGHLREHGSHRNCHIKYYKQALYISQTNPEEYSSSEKLLRASCRG